MVQPYTCLLPFVSLLATTTILSPFPSPNETPYILQVMLVGYPIAFLVGWYLMFKRLQRPTRIAQRIRAALDEGRETGGLHRFWDAFEVEVAAR